MPAVIGVGFGMLDPAVPPVNLPAYLALSAAVFALPLLTVVPWVASARSLLTRPARRNVVPADHRVRASQDGGS